MPEAFPAIESALYRKIARRLIPFLFVLYLVAFIDRVNVGFAKLQMSGDLGLSEAVYGMGAGIFFLGYFLFEVPSNIVLHKVGAKLWIARILVLWGLVSAGMMFVNSAHSFYWLRFLLGLSEAGFFPGIILYLTYWFPASQRAKTNALFLTAIGVSGVVGGPVSGWIMSGLDGWQGLRGWQWLFLLEGLPAVILGGVTYFFLDDGPQQAAWLTEKEREILLQRLAYEQEGEGNGHHSLREMFACGRVWLLAGVYFCIVLGLYGISFWLPQLIHDLQQGGLLLTGLLSSIPYLIALPVMLAVAHRSDRHRERRWHLVASACLGAVGLLAVVWMRDQPHLSILALGLAASGILSTLSVFWALPAAFLSGRAAAGGIALINSVGNLGGYFGPVILGWVKQNTGNIDAGLYLLSGGMLLAGVLVVLMRRD